VANQPGNHRQPWTPAQDKELKHLAAGNTPTRGIGVKLGRTEDAGSLEPEARTEA
jgi:hypothetical protein